MHTFFLVIELFIHIINLHPLSLSVVRRRSTSMEGLFTLDDRKERRSDVENSEDERRRLSIGSLKKKALNASNKLTHSLKKRGKRKVEHRASSFTIEDVRDEQEERAVFTFQQELLNRNLLTDKQNDYHLLLRLVRYEYTTH